MKRLAKELRTGHSCVNPAGFAAAFNYWGNAREALDFVRVLIAAAIGAKGHEKPRCQEVAGAGEAIEKVVVRVFPEQTLDDLVEALD